MYWISPWNKLSIRVSFLFIQSAAGCPWQFPHSVCFPPSTALSFSDAMHPLGLTHEFQSYFQICPTQMAQRTQVDTTGHTHKELVHHIWACSLIVSATFKTEICSCKAKLKTKTFHKLHDSVLLVVSTVAWPCSLVSGYKILGKLKGAALWAELSRLLWEV